jgi:hypothetical protein
MEGNVVECGQRQLWELALVDESSPWSGEAYTLLQSTDPEDREHHFKAVNPILGFWVIDLPKQNDHSSKPTVSRERCGTALERHEYQ